MQIVKMMVMMDCSVMVKLWMKMNGVMKNVKGFEGACPNSTCTIHYVQWRSADQVEIKSVYGNSGGFG